MASLSEAEPGALKLVPESLARRYGVIPVRETDRQIFIATSNPLDVEAEQALGFASSRTPVFLVAAPLAILEAIDQLYSPDRVVEALLGTVDGDIADAVQLVEDIAPELLQSSDVSTKPVVMLTNLILQEAVRERASDIHIEPGRSGGAVRMRVDGVLRNQMQLPMAALSRVISRIKILGKLDIADRLRPQDGRARIKIHGKSYDLRMSTVPARDAEKAVIRVLDAEGAPPLGALGLAQKELERLRQLMGHREGIVLVTGPTGSGKTTTLYAMVRELAAGAVNVMTVEDPVEY
ncbi:MAG TPA: ATPase, T2SS/T4P/T4SS family, partial [Gemmatimonadaceae bacterium]